MKASWFLTTPLLLIASVSAWADPSDVTQPMGKSVYGSVGGAYDEDNGPQFKAAAKVETGPINIKGSIQLGASEQRPMSAGQPSPPSVPQASATVQWTNLGQGETEGCKIGQGPCFTPMVQARFERNLALNRPYGVYAGAGILLRAHEHLGDNFTFRTRLEAGGEVGASAIEDPKAKEGDKWKSGTTAGFTGPLAVLGAIQPFAEGGVGVCYHLDEATRNRLCADLQLSLRPRVTGMDTGVGLRLGYEHVFAEDVTKGPILYIASESRAQGNVVTDYQQGGRGGATQGEANTGVAVGLAY